MNWQQRISASIVAESVAPAAPRWTGNVPFCSEECPHHDGKRCQLLGFRPGTICEPVVEAMGAEIARRP